MKAKLTLLFTCGILFTQAQFIDQIFISPSSPTTNDSVYFVANCYFGSGTCDQKSQLLNINGSEISASSMHCLGMLTYICNATDSFNLGMLAAGTYHLTFSLDAGYGISPCTPGIVAGPTDSLTFTVQSATGISHSAPAEIRIAPNPTSGKATITTLGTNQTGIFEIWNNTGRLVKKWISPNGETTIDCSNMSNGIYRIIFTSEKGQKKSVNLIRID